MYTPYTGTVYHDVPLVVAVNLLQLVMITVGIEAHEAQRRSESKSGNENENERQGRRAQGDGLRGFTRQGNRVHASLPVYLRNDEPVKCESDK